MFHKIKKKLEVNEIVYLIDFGLAKEFNNCDGEHIKEEKIKSF